MVRRAFSPPERTETFFSIPGSEGTSRFISTSGKRGSSIDSDGNSKTTFEAFVTPFNEKDYFTSKSYDKSLYKDSTVAKQMKQDWGNQTDAGTIIHAVFESIVNPDKSLNLTDDQYKLFGETVDKGKEKIEGLILDFGKHQRKTSSMFCIYRSTYYFKTTCKLFWKNNKQ